MSKAGERLLGAADEALAIARGEQEPAKLHVPPDVEVKAIRQKLSLTQDDFAAEFGFTIDQIKQWEQNRSRPLGGARAYLLLIDSAPDLVREVLQQIKTEAAAKEAAA